MEGSFKRTLFWFSVGTYSLGFMSGRDLFPCEIMHLYINTFLKFIPAL